MHSSTDLDFYLTSTPSLILIQFVLIDVTQNGIYRRVFGFLTQEQLVLYTSNLLLFNGKYCIYTTLN